MLSRADAESRGSEEEEVGLGEVGAESESKEVMLRRAVLSARARATSYRE